MKFVSLFRTAALLSTLLLATGCERAIFHFVNRGLPPPEATVVFAPDLDLALDVYRPRGASAGGTPVVVFFYGGSWERGAREQYRFVGRQLAANGILAIVADYRTYPRAGFPAFMDDAAKAVKWSHDHAEHWGGDPDRLFVAGHSAGAQIAALLGTDAHYLQRYDIVPAELAGVIGLSGPYDFAISKRLQRIFGPPGQWHLAQPVNFVDGDEPGFLLVHGLRDRIVESVDSVELAGKLRAHDVEARLVLLPEGTHSTPLAGLYDPQRAPAVLAAMLAFVRRDPGEPYFRVFNPVLQAQKFDPDGTCIARWVPELASLPAPLRHAPWRDPGEWPRAATDYPRQPIVDLAASRSATFAACRGLG